MSGRFLFAHSIHAGCRFYETLSITVSGPILLWISVFTSDKSKLLLDLRQSRSLRNPFRWKDLSIFSRKRKEQ